jgi:hypothetical protein
MDCREQRFTACPYTTFSFFTRKNRYERNAFIAPNEIQKDFIREASGTKRKNLGMTKKRKPAFDIRERRSLIIQK